MVAGEQRQIPCFAATGSGDAVGENVRHVVGLDCDLGWSQTLIAAYVAIYVAFFVFFAVTLRSVEDNFRIKDELKLTGLIGILAVIPWLLFNRVSSMQTINKETFPFSTLSLIVAVFAAFYLSTVWPLIRSYSAPAKVAEDAPEPAVGDLENLEVRLLIPSLAADGGGFRSSLLARSNGSREFISAVD